MNSYAYARNNPLLYVDPNGKDAEYFNQSARQVIYGNYTNDVTTLGTVTQVGLGLTGLDIVGDIRDLSHDFGNWQWSWSHAGKTGLDLIGLVPVIGALKYSDEAVVLINKGSSQIAKQADDSAKLTQLNKKFDNLKEHTTYDDLRAAQGDLAGKPIVNQNTGKVFNHLDEVQKAQKGFLNIIGKVNKYLSHSQLTTELIKGLRNLLGRVSKLLDYTEGFIPRIKKK